MRKPLFLFVLFCVFTQLILLGQKDELGLFQKQVSKNQHDTSLCNVYDNWANSLYIRNLDSAAILWGKMREIAERNYIRLKSPRNKTEEKLRKVFGSKLANSMGGIAYHQQMSGNLEEALQLNFKAHNVATFVKDSLAMGTLLNNIGYIFELYGDFPKAIQHYEKSKKIKGLMGDSASMAYTLSNIGILKYRQGKPEEAMQIFKQSLEIRIRLNDQRGIASSYSNMGTILRDVGKYDEAQEYFDKCLAIQEKINDTHGKCITLNHLGVLQDRYGHPEKAIQLYEQSYNLAASLNYLGSMVYSVDNIGWDYYKMKNYSRALEFGKESMLLAEKLGNPENLKNASELLFKVYKATGRKAEAFDYYEKYILMRDSLNVENLERQLKEAKLKSNYELKSQKMNALRQKEKLIRDNEKKVADARARYDRMLRLALIIGLVICVISIFLIWQRFKVTKNQNKIINDQRLEVIRQKGLIEAKQKEVMDSIQYAKRIQQSLLPSEKAIVKMMSKKGK